MAHFLSPLSHHMNSPVQFVRPDAKLVDAEAQLRQWNISCLAVLDYSDRLVGAISLSDLLREGEVESIAAGRRGPLKYPDKTISAAMTSPVVSLDVAKPLADAAQLMLDQHVHRVFVAEGHRIDGVVSARDVCSVVAEVGVDTPVENSMSSPVVSIESSVEARDATTTLQQEAVSLLAVKNAEWPVGIYGQLEALSCRGQNETPVAQVMSSAFICVAPSLPLHYAAGRLAATHSRCALVVDQADQSQLVGILTPLDVTRAALARSWEE